MEADQRELRQLVDNFLMAHKDQKFTIHEIAEAIGAPDTQELIAAMTSVVRCPFTSCQSLDTALSGTADNQGYEVHHCNRCNRNFHVQRDAKGGGYSILGWYGEDATTKH